MEQEKKYGIVFAGGGAKGAYQAGVLLAMQELDLIKDIEAAAGASVGSLNMLFLSGTDMKKAYDVWDGLQAKDFVSLDDNGYDITRAGDGIFSRDGLIRIIDNNIDLQKVSDSVIPYYVTVSRKSEGEHFVPEYVKLNGMSGEKIKTYLLASSALPVIYDAVTIDNVMYYDGGLTDNTPISALYRNGIRDIIIISNNNKYVPEKYRFPDANLYTLVPSENLDLDTLWGTADLSKSRAAYRLKLGYLDAKAMLPALLKGEKIPDVSKNRVIAEQDMQRNKVQSEFNRDMDGLKGIMSKYGMDDLA